MATESVRTRRKFKSDWDEIEYLYHKILSWFYERGDRSKALRFCDRLEGLLRRASPDHLAILGEECWSLVYEVRGDLRKAIEHRKNEIRLIKRLRKSALNSPQRDFLLHGYDISDLSDRYDLLAILYHDAGDLPTALKVLRQSKQLCEAHGIPFDGQDILDEYLAERAANGSKKNGR
jgi:tetratricopeptide (TPR) repeat protein